MVDEVDQLFRKQVNLYRLQEMVDGIITRVTAGGPRFRLTEELIQQFHTVAMQGLLDTAGRYRTIPVHINNSPHKTPPWIDVPTHVQTLCRYVDENWNGRDLVHLSAFTMWRLNWIHPFADGNGRVSRAIAYLVLCAKHGELLPAKNTVIAQIVANKQPYYAALRQSDDAHAAGADPAVSTQPLEAFLTYCLKEQLKTALN